MRYVDKIRCRAEWEGRDELLQVGARLTQLLRRNSSIAVKGSHSKK